jgi:pimeloyl-ACP methyl ester carboxylesterase
MDHLDIASAHIHGYSVGAETAIKLAATHPTRVRSLCAGGSGWTDKDSYKNDYVDLGPPIDCMRCCWYPCCLPCCCEKLTGAVPDLRSVKACALGMHELLDIQESQMSAIGVPVHGLVGEKDDKRKWLERMQGVVPNYGLTVVPKRGHLDAVDDPIYRDSLVTFFETARAGKSD